MSLYTQKTCPDCDSSYFGLKCQECGFDEKRHKGPIKKLSEKSAKPVDKQCAWYTGDHRCRLIWTLRVQGRPLYCRFHWEYADHAEPDLEHQKQFFKRWREHYLRNFPTAPFIFWRPEEELIACLMEGKRLPERSEEGRCLAMLEILGRLDPNHRDLPFWRWELERAKERNPFH